MREMDGLTNGSLLGPAPLRVRYRDSWLGTGRATATSVSGSVSP